MHYCDVAQREYTVIGTVLIVAAVLGVAVLWPVIPDVPILGAGVIVGFLSGVLSVLAGEEYSFREVGPDQFVGLSNVLIGGWLIALAVTGLVVGITSFTVSLVLSMLGAAGVAILGVGVERIRGGRYFRL